MIPVKEPASNRIAPALATPLSSTVESNEHHPALAATVVDSDDWGLPPIESIWDMDVRVEWLIDHMIPLRGVTMVSGDSGDGKTWLALDIAGAVARGRQFSGLGVAQRKVLYLDRENPAAVIKKRLELLGIDRNPNLKVWGAWADAEPPGPDDSDLINFARSHAPLIIFDSLVGFYDGDENSATQVRAFMDHFRKLAHLGATILLLHHTGKSESASLFRGSSDFKGSVDMAYVLNGTTLEAKLTAVQLRYFKARFAPGQHFRFNLVERSGFAGGVDVRPEALNDVEVLSGIIAERPGMTTTEVKEAAKAKGISRRKVDEAFRTVPCRREKHGKSLLIYPPDAGVAA